MECIMRLPLAAGEQDCSVLFICRKCGSPAGIICIDMA